MQRIFFLFTMFAFFTLPAQSKNVLLENYIIKIAPFDTVKKNSPVKKNDKEEKWNNFWKKFTSAIYAKDKTKIAELTSKDFYDGGGGTVDYWLDSEVFINETKFNSFKNILKKGAGNFKGYDGVPYKATGKNKSGDLFFEYKNNQWLFGGIVGD